MDEYPRPGDFVEWRDRYGKELGLVVIGNRELKGLVQRLDPEEAEYSNDTLIGIALSGRYRGSIVICDEDETMTVKHGHVHIDR